MNNNIRLAKSGQVDPVTIQKDIETSLRLIKEMESQAHIKGATNLRYWLSQGKELELSARAQTRILEQQQQELLAAINDFNNQQAVLRRQNLINTLGLTTQ